MAGKRKKWLRRILLFLLSLAVLAGAGVAWLLLDPACFLSFFERGLAARAGVTLVHDELVVNRKRGLNYTVHVQNVRAVTRDGNVPVLSAEVLNLDLDLSGILRKKIVIRDLFLKAPDLSLYIREDGTLAAGTVKLARLPKNGGNGDGGDVSLKRLQVSGGRLTVIFPESAHFPPLAAEEITGTLNPDTGAVNAYARVGMGSPTGRFSLSGHAGPGDVAAQFALTDFSLSGLHLPGNDNTRGDMPLDGRIQFSGTLKKTGEGPLDLAASLELEDASLGNPRFPRGRADFALGPVKIGASRAPGGVFRALASWDRFTFPILEASGRFESHMEPGSPPVLSFSAETTDFDWKDFKPYLVSFLGVKASKWVNEHLTKGRLTGVRVRMGEPALPRLGEPDGGFPLDVSARVSGLRLTINDRVPPISEIAADLHVSTEGLSADLAHAEAPGVTVTAGRYSLNWSVHDVTPMNLDLEARADMGTAWPATIRSFSLPDWARRLEVEGPARVLVAWDTPDVDGPEPDYWMVRTEPQGASLRYEDPALPLFGTDLAGGVVVEGGKLSLDDVSLDWDDVRARAQGDIPFDRDAPFSLEIRLQHMEELLPFYAEPFHIMRAWLPKDLSGRLTVSRKKRAGESQPMVFAVSATDEQGQVFNGSFAVDQGHWRLGPVDGGMGRAHFSGSIGTDTGDGDFAVRIGPEEDPDFRLSIHAGAGQAVVGLKGKKLDVADLENWRVGPALDESHQFLGARARGSESPVWPWREISLEASLGGLSLSPELSGPMDLTAFADFGQGYSVTVSRLQWGLRQGRFTLENHQGRAGFSAWLNRLDLAPWLRYIQSLPPGGPLGGGSGNRRAFSAEGFVPDLASLEGTMRVEAMTAPGNEAAPYTAAVRFQRVDHGFAGTWFMGYGDQDLALTLKAREDGRSLTASSGRLDLLPAFSVAAAMAPLTGGAASGGYSRTDLSVSVKDLAVAPGLSGPLRAEAVLGETPEGPGRAMVIKSFDVLGQKGSGRVFLDEKTPRLDLTLSRLDLSETARLYQKLSSLDLSETISVLEKQEAEKGGALAFSVEAPDALVPPGEKLPFSVMGNLQFGDGFTLVAEKVEMGEQKGSVHLFLGREETRVQAEFGYLDLAQWDRIADAARSEAGSLTPSAGEKGPGQKIALKLPLSQKTVDIDLTAERLKFLETSFDNLVFSGKASSTEALIRELSWKKDKEPVFRLFTQIEKRGEDLWQGRLDSRFEDLGDVTKLLVPPADRDKGDFPIQGGKTTCSIVADLTPQPDGLWKPKGTLKFESREGRIRRGGGVLLLFAALSPDNYVRLLTGQPSELTGGGAVFETMEGDTTFDGGKINVDRFDFQAPSLRYIATGTVDVTAYTQDLRICLQPFGTLNRIISYAPGLNWVLQNKDGAIFETCFRAEGSISDPKMTAIPKSMIPTRLGDIF